ncbi:hypothetical protein ES703_59572 [subsurface metagenome]
MESDRRLRLFVGPASFGITWSWRDRAIILSWVAETEAPNLIWMRMVVFKLGWPPIRHVVNFTDRD